MAKAKRTRAVRIVPAPAWIKNKSDQEKWISRFLYVLKRDFRNSNSAISLILEDKDLARRCATRIRSYVDKRVTVSFYAERKARGVFYKKRLETAIGGIQVAITLYGEQKRYETVASLQICEAEFLAQLERCNTAFAPKRHGRDRDHSILSECRSLLEEKLGKRLTDATLADLVNAGFEADGNIPKEPITDEHIRKNLAAFTRNNPCWSNHVVPNLTLP